VATNPARGLGSRLRRLSRLNVPLQPQRLIAPAAVGCKRVLSRDSCVVSSIAAQPLLRGSERFGGDARSIRRQLFADLDGSSDPRQLDPVKREEASLESLLHANELGILNGDLSLVVNIVVNPVAPIG